MPSAVSPHRIPWLILTGAGAVGVIMIAEYAPSVLPYLPIALGLLVAGLGLKVIGRRVVESKFLTAPWLIILALVAAVAAYAFFAPEIDLASLARHLPGPVARFFR